MRKLFIVFAVLLFLVSISLPVFATIDSYSYNGVDLPYFWDYSDEYSYLVLVEREDGLCFFVSDVRFVYGSAGVYVNSNVTLRTFMLSDDSLRWCLVNESFYSSGSHVMNFSGDTLVWSSHDLSDYSGSVHFEGDPNFSMAPPMKTVQEVTEEHLLVQGPVIVRTMMILTACGVGCLASLISLRIFGRRLLPFLKQ